MKKLKQTLLMLLVLTVLISYANAAFPYNTKWLRYSDDRIIYQINTSGLTSNTANIYVEFTVDTNFLQSFINKWSSYCDPSGAYPWFYPTVEYASTQNNNPRFAKIVEMNNFVTFTVGSCGTVQLPTRFKVLLPNGVLDGGDSFANYQHYLFVNYKYPYVWDFEETMGIFPYYVFNNSAGTVGYDATYERGYYIVPDGGRTFLPINITVNTETDSGKYMVCTLSLDPFYSDIWMVIHLTDGNIYDITGAFNGERCVDLAKAMKERAGLSGTYSISGIGIRDDEDSYRLMWFWVIPDTILQMIRMGI